MVATLFIFTGLKLSAAKLYRLRTFFKYARHAERKDLNLKAENQLVMAETARELGIPWPDFNDGICYTDIIKQDSLGVSLIEFYCTRYKGSAPKMGWLQRIQNGQITIDGIVVKDEQSILRVGCKLVYHRLPWREPYAPYRLHILYEDDHMLAIDKPSGLQVLPGGLFQQRTVLTQLQWKDRNLSHSDSDMEKGPCLLESHPVPVHRLGRGTSGILLCAKSKIAKVKLAFDFAEGAHCISNKRVCEFQTLEHKRRISKTYRALAEGLIDQNMIIVKQAIGKMQYAGVASGLYVASPLGKPAESKVVVLHRNEEKNCTLVEVEILSGRPHQIRIHMAYIGHPLVGDPLYISGGRPSLPLIRDPSEFTNGVIEKDGGYQRSSNSMPGDCGYYLHAHKVNFFHPVMDEIMEIISPPPAILLMASELARS